MRGFIDVIMFVGLLACLLVISMAIASAACSARWSGSGMDTSWGPIKGCQLQLEDGKWIPDDRYRETGEKP
jgi:hypothetical protein